MSLYRALFPALCLATAIATSSCASFQKSLDKGDLAAATELAQKMKGQEQRAALEALGSASLKAGKPQAAIDFYSRAERPDLVLETVDGLAARGAFGKPEFGQAAKAIGQLGKSSGTDAALAAARRLMSYSNSGFSSLPGQAEYDAILAAGGVSGKEADLAVAEAALERNAHWKLGGEYAKQNFEQAEERFEAAGERARLAETLLAHGDLLLEERIDSGAAARYAKAGKEEAWINSKLGQRYARAGSDRDIPLAAMYFRRAGDTAALAAIAPELARRELSMNRPDKALEAFRESGQPESAWAGELAKGYAKDYRYAEAAFWYEKAGDAAKAKPQWKAAGQASERKKDWTAALEQYTKAGDEAGVKLAQECLGDAAMASKEYRTALDYYGKAGDLYKSRNAMGGLGEQAEAAADYAAALEWYEKAEDSLEANSLRRTWAAALTKEGRHEEAAALYEAAGDRWEAGESQVKALEALYAKRDFARAYAYRKGWDVEGAAESLIDAALKAEAAGEAEKILAGAGMDKREAWTAIAEKAKEAGLSSIALAYYEKLGSKAEIAEIREAAAYEALEKGRLDEAYALLSKTSMGAKEAQATVLRRAVGEGRDEEARAFLEKSGSKKADAALRVAEAAAGAGNWASAARQYEVAGKKAKAAEYYVKAAENSTSVGEWAEAETFYAKAGIAPAEIRQRLAGRALDQEMPAKAAEILERDGKGHDAAVLAAAGLLFDRTRYDEGIEFLKGEGIEEKAAALRAADAAAKAKAPVAALSYYRLAGEEAKAKAWEAKAVEKSLADAAWDMAFDLQVKGGAAEAAAAARVADAAAKAASSVAAVKYYLLAGQGAKAKPWYAKAITSLLEEGELELAAEYAEKSGDAAAIEKTGSRLACRGEMVGYIDENGISADSFIEFLQKLEKAYGSRVLWETLHNTSTYYLDKGIEMALGVDLKSANIDVANRILRQSSQYSNYATMLSNLWVEMTK